MKTHTALSGPLAVLLLPRSTKDLLTFGKAVHDAMLGNPNFPSPNPPLEVLKANLEVLDNAETKAATRAKGAAIARDAIKRQVINDLYHLCDYVQGVDSLDEDHCRTNGEDRVLEVLVAAEFKRP